jgi:hypothetical protein
MSRCTGAGCAVERVRVDEQGGKELGKDDASDASDGIIRCRGRTWFVECGVVVGVVLIL